MTRGNKPSLRRRVAQSAPSAGLFGYMRGTIEIVGDVLSPDPESWNSDLGIECRDENGRPVYSTGKEIEREDDAT